MKTKTLLKFTGLFIAILLICLVFSLLFGSKNIIVAIMAVVLSIVLIKQDLKKNLTTNFLKILLTNLIVGILAFLACKIPSLSFLIAFLTIFLIVILTKDINKLIYYVFSLEFVYLISSNISYSGLNIRLLSLIGGSILVILINVLVHKLMNKKVSKNQHSNSKEDVSKHPSTKLTSKNLTLKETIYSKFRKDKQHYLFAIELAIIVAISEFITIFFNIPTAKWLSFTAIGILRPNTNLIIKGFKKIKGTIIGVIVFILIDILILSQGTITILGLNISSITIATILTIIFSYLYTMFYLENKYVIRIIFSTLLALSIAFICIPQTNFITDRILFIIIGTVLCIFINYSMKESTKV